MQLMPIEGIDSAFAIPTEIGVEMDGLQYHLQKRAPCGIAG